MVNFMSHITQDSSIPVVIKITEKENIIINDSGSVI